ncbi:PTS sugar transporter subunit IIA [Candidatus Stoquefichus massiliensis]|uniref:PTS sugar transporter subunit IIA n=1 Tax=Candidatus Stoquefichus massiliensis TaxID=1470350 RepID=UPI000488CA0A|nr:PTS sugar transporter subunit IIA [Candidatus Stoquefichus massiliensis]
MKYVVLVSHGEFAEGLANALMMLAGQKEEVIAVGLKDGKTADEFAVQFEKAIQPITERDEIILLGDLIGGSPLTTAMNVMNDLGMGTQTVVIGGMNLPLALTTVLMKDAFDKEALVEQVLSEAQSALKEFKIEVDEEDEI